MNISASRAFYLGIITTAIVSFTGVFIRDEIGNIALLTGLSYGWVVSVIVHTVSTAYYGIRESWGLQNDKE